MIPKLIVDLWTLGVTLAGSIDSIALLYLQSGKIFQLKCTHSEYTHLLVTAMRLALLSNHEAEVYNWLHHYC